MFDPTKSRYKYLNFQNNVVYRRFVDSNLQMSTNKISSKDDPNLHHGSYGALLFKPEWKAKREEIILRDKFCVICKSEYSLHVHHRQYHFIVRENRFKLPWEYTNNLLITLCQNCHKKGHSKYKVPTINI